MNASHAAVQPNSVQGDQQAASVAMITNPAYMTLRGEKYDIVIVS